MKNYKHSMMIEDKIKKRLEVIRFSLNMLRREMRKSHFVQPYLIRQEDKLTIERKILKNLLNG